MKKPLDLACSPQSLHVRFEFDLFVLQLDAMFDVIGIESVAGERVMFALKLRDLSFEGFVFSGQFLWCHSDRSIRRRDCWRLWP